MAVLLASHSGFAQGEINVTGQDEPGVTEPQDRPSAPTTATLQAVGDGGDRDLPVTETLHEKLRSVLGRPRGLTSEAVARRAVESSWDVRAREINHHIADLDVARAMQVVVPDVTLSVQYTRKSSVDEGNLLGGNGLVGANATGPLNDPATSPNTLADGVVLAAIPTSSLFPMPLDEYWLQGSVNVPLSEYALQSRHGLLAARHNRRAARLSERASRLAAATSAKLAYYDWVRTKLQVVVAEQAFGQVNEQLEITQFLLETGRLSQADVLRAQSQVAHRKLLVSRAHQQELLARDAVRTLMHDEKDADYEVGEAVMTMPIAEDPGGTLEHLYQEALRNRLELRALEARARALRDAGKAVLADQCMRDRYVIYFIRG